MELSGCSLESESELGQEKVQPTMEESGTKSGSNEEGIDTSDEVRTDVSDGEAQMAQTRRADTSAKEGTDLSVEEGTKRWSKKAQTAQAERTY